MSETTPPAVYQGFDRMFLGGEWRAGSGGPLIDSDPYIGDVLTEI
ncbi:hypothetical protein ABZ215_26575 [Amycolatopsis sp. NPDC006131]